MKDGINWWLMFAAFAIGISTGSLIRQVTFDHTFDLKIHDLAEMKKACEIDLPRSQKCEIRFHQEITYDRAPQR